MLRDPVIQNARRSPHLASPKASPGQCLSLGVNYVSDNLKLGRCLIALAVVLVTALSLNGCHPAGSESIPVDVYEGVDTSASWRPHLSDTAAMTVQLSERLQPGFDRIALYRVDQHSHEFYDDVAPESPDDFQDLIVRQLGVDAHSNGTYPAPFWSDIARSVKSDRRRSICVLFSDGDDDDMSSASHRRIRAAATSIASCPQVAAVAIVGISPDNWDSLRTDLAPLGGRLHLYNAEQVDTETINELADGLGR